MEVWVIDDEQPILSMITAAMQLDGHHVRTFLAASAAIEAAYAPSPVPDLLLLDWFLGGAAGAATVSRLRELLETTKLVVMSGDPHSKSEIPNGIGWLSKPFRLAELRQLTQKA